MIQDLKQYAYLGIPWWINDDTLMLQDDEERGKPINENKYFVNNLILTYLNYI